MIGGGNQDCATSQRELLNVHERVLREPTGHMREWVTGVLSMLNSATGIPLIARDGANMAAGYTTEEVPTCRKDTP
jgi:hypothetical protein